MLESLFSKVAGLKALVAAFESQNTNRAKKKKKKNSKVFKYKKTKKKKKKKKRAANVVQVLKLTSTKAYSKDDVTGRFLKDTPSIFAKPICEIFQ